MAPLDLWTEFAHTVGITRFLSPSVELRSDYTRLERQNRNALSRPAKENVAQVRLLVLHRETVALTGDHLSGRHRASAATAAGGERTPLRCDARAAHMPRAAKFQVHHLLDQFARLLHVFRILLDAAYDDIDRLVTHLL